MKCIYGSQIQFIHYITCKYSFAAIKEGSQRKKKLNFASKVSLGREGMPPMPMDYYIIAVMFTIRRQANDIFDISITRHIP